MQSSGDATVGSLGAEGSAAVPHALPNAPTRLIGRETQVERLLALLTSERLITLTGPPGSGKTRLAVDVAHRALGSFADGAWFVSLAPVQDEDLVAHAVAQVLSISEQPGGSMRDIVGRYFAERELLLVLDNFEHLVDGATAVASWMAAAPRLCVLVTSRTALHLTGEHEFVVPPLRVPRDPDDPAAASSESVQLFMERARSVASDFDPDERTLSDVARICSRLDGLPLAVELAAARTKALPTTAILESTRAQPRPVDARGTRRPRATSVAACCRVLELWTAGAGRAGRAPAPLGVSGRVDVWRPPTRSRWLPTSFARIPWTSCRRCSTRA